MEESLAKRRIEAYRMGRKRRGDIRVFLLWALSDHAMHGYEIIHFLGDKTYGLWAPSPGSVYPTLQTLEEQGLVSATRAGDKKVYAITDAGRTALHGMEVGGFDNDPQQLQPIKDLREVNATIRGLMRAIITRGSVDDLTHAAKIMHETRARLLGVYNDLPKKAARPK